MLGRTRMFGASGAHRDAFKGPFAAKAMELRDSARLDQKARIARGS
jgi:hypothetical protein